MRRWAQRIATGACAVAVLGPAAGCDTAGTSPPAAGAGSGASAAATASSVAPTALAPTRRPAAEAGGVCQLLDYGVVEQTLGVSFEVAAGGQQDATYTCVLRRTGVSVPDVTLAVTPTTVDPTIFRNSVVPKGAAAVSGLGKVAYHAPLPAVPDAGRGPGIEVGWLAGNNRILVLRCTLSADATAQVVTELTGKLVELARKVDQTP